MRLATLSFSLVTLFAATSMKVAQGLVARHDKRHSSRRHRTTNSHHHHHKSNSNRKNNKIAGEASMGYPSRLDIEHRATEFNSFRSNEIVAAPASLHILQETMVGSEVTKMEMERLARRLRLLGRGGNEYEKRLQKISSTSKKHLSRGKKTNNKMKASSLGN
ncbi:hypothetical protein BKA57DRAFT_471237 [Linnemannia elongata]|nr:hypothetical protein BKA57DRAFT_471237 [Linnemannia elongata]